MKHGHGQARELGCSAGIALKRADVMQIQGLGFRV